jgi:hypothetical protein
LNMAAVLAQMNGDAIRAAALRRVRRREQIRICGPADLADRRHVVDVDTELDHSK